MRLFLTGVWLSLLLSGIGYIFWQSELKFTMPTPVPVHYHDVPIGSIVHAGAEIASKNHRPLLIHFFNPDCPCSRFNMPHFKSLVKKYSSSVDFAMVVLTDKDYSADDIREKYNIDIPVSFNNEIAGQCGVYATPQAVILNADSKMVYRGNYNRTRYCTDKKTNFAQIALDSLLAGNEKSMLAKQAYTAYGCQAPGCEK